MTTLSGVSIEIVSSAPNAYAKRVEGRFVRHWPTEFGVEQLEVAALRRSATDVRSDKVGSVRPTRREVGPIEIGNRRVLGKPHAANNGAESRSRRGVQEFDSVQRSFERKRVTRRIECGELAVDWRSISFVGEDKARSHGMAGLGIQEARRPS